MFEYFGLERCALSLLTDICKNDMIMLDQTTERKTHQFARWEWEWQRHWKHARSIQEQLWIRAIGLGKPRQRWKAGNLAESFGSQLELGKWENFGGDMMWHGSRLWVRPPCCRLGFKAAAVDLTEPSAVLAEALNLAKATPQDCGVLSTRQLRGTGRMSWGCDEVGCCDKTAAGRDGHSNLLSTLAYLIYIDFPI
jgi:hypothetical protein